MRFVHVQRKQIILTHFWPSFYAPKPHNHYLISLLSSNLRKSSFCDESLRKLFLYFLLSIINRHDVNFLRYPAVFGLFLDQRSRLETKDLRLGRLSVCRVLIILSLYERAAILVFKIQPCSLTLPFCQSCQSKNASLCLTHVLANSD